MKIENNTVKTDQGDFHFGVIVGFSPSDSGATNVYIGVPFDEINCIALPSDFFESLKIAFRNYQEEKQIRAKKLEAEKYNSLMDIEINISLRALYEIIRKVTE